MNIFLWDATFSFQVSTAFDRVSWYPYCTVYSTVKLEGRSLGVGKDFDRIIIWNLLGRNTVRQPIIPGIFLLPGNGRLETFYVIDLKFHFKGPPTRRAGGRHSPVVIPFKSHPSVIIDAVI